MTSDIGFVVLHYLTLDDTQKCVNSILANDLEAPIIIVDNGSDNDSGKKLKEIFNDIKYVEVISVNENKGFARGNNVGIRYLKENYNSKFVVVLNNDTLVNQKDICKIIYKEYEKSKFAVLGPQIINLNGDNNSSPVEYIVDSKKKLNVLLLKRCIKYIICKLHLDFILHDVGTSQKFVGLYDNTVRYEDVKLHGACLIFSPIFFDNFIGFNESTFLYFEEDILYLEMMKSGLKTVYNPEISITHLEDSSTSYITKTNRNKKMFVLKNEIKSLNIIAKLNFF